MARTRFQNFDHVHEVFAGFGPVAVRRMFGGAGVYADGVMFAIVVDGEIFLKADETTSPAFVAEGMTPFAYETGKGKRAVMSYWRMPARLYDDTDELAAWAREALAVARRRKQDGARVKSIVNKSARKSPRRGAR